MSDPNHRRKRVVNGKKVKRGSWTYIKNNHVRAWARNKEQDWLAGVEKKNGKEGHVYIFNLGYGSLYKVGCTYNIAKRLKTLQASNPKMKCIWSAWVKDMKDVEEKLHKQFANKRLDRELFMLTQEQIIHANNMVNKIKEAYEQ